MGARRPFLVKGLHLANVHDKERTLQRDISTRVESTMPEEAIVGVPAYPVVPDAVRGAFEGVPFLLAWKLRRRG